MGICWLSRYLYNVKFLLLIIINFRKIPFRSESERLAIVQSEHKKEKLI